VRLERQGGESWCGTTRAYPGLEDDMADALRDSVTLAPGTGGAEVPHLADDVPQAVEEHAPRPRGDMPLPARELTRSVLGLLDAVA
jgi:hypothetical protein